MHSIAFRIRPHAVPCGPGRCLSGVPGHPAGINLSSGQAVPAAPRGSLPQTTEGRLSLPYCLLNIRRTSSPSSVTSCISIDAVDKYCRAFLYLRIASPGCAQDTEHTDEGVLAAMAVLIQDAGSCAQALIDWRDAAIFMKGGMGRRAVACPAHPLTPRTPMGKLC